ncbi:hypothetical protein EDD16DRAFT_1559663, partial [Pisolithus croceorrhizus]
CDPMFSRALLIACIILFFKVPATLGAVVVRSALSSTTLSSTAPAQETYFHGLMWKGYEHEVVGPESSEVPHPTPALNSPKDRSVVEAVQRDPSPAPDNVWAGLENQNKPQRLRREGDTDKEPRSPTPHTGSGAMWKGREHEEAIRGV